MYIYIYIYIYIQGVSQKCLTNKMKKKIDIQFLFNPPLVFVISLTDIMLPSSSSSSSLHRDIFNELEFVTCLMCREKLKDPKVFPCLHSCCYECIVNKLAENSQDAKTGLICPKCQATVEVRYAVYCTFFPT